MLIGAIINGHYTNDKQELKDYFDNKDVTNVPEIAMAEITHKMGLRFGQEEKFPEIKHHSSEEQPIIVKYEDEVKKQLKTFKRNMVK